MTKIVSGGGIQSNKTVQSQSGWKREPIPKAVNVPAAAQLGRSEQFRKPPLEQGKGYETKPMAATGIANVRQGHSGVGPGGGGRTIYARGSQCPTPTVGPMEKGRDILSGYGNDIPGRR
jgi:hypothetical protein